MAKSFEKMSDGDCRIVPPDVQCVTHGQPLIDCANQRIAQVKEARIMADRRTAWAHTWKDFANKTRIEINKLKAKYGNM